MLDLNQRSPKTSVLQTDALVHYVNPPCHPQSHPILNLLDEQLPGGLSLLGSFFLERHKDQGLEYVI